MPASEEIDQARGKVGTSCRMFDKTDLIKLANRRMPFGRYKDRLLMDLPEEYLLWFSAKGYPEGELGHLLALMLEIDRNGLKNLLLPLKHAATDT